ncbi:OmpA family protein [Beggiatoa leptomitoformis]|uniref:OmpA family protein n=1 Tax=Beggiatoa leptomitoformis TaxID=288004 RepID=A0A2N9YHY4_9GAMM|nr:OmpA family protein [Beggiatoa leptomitoformis]AUI70117.1 OmpA family protein [Beggiatoa leptomitoformis]QGX03635.1 OmpA family protein [Beggiatoa leptomitoformis]
MQIPRQAKLTLINGIIIGFAALTVSSGFADSIPILADAVATPNTATLPASTMSSTTNATDAEVTQETRLLLDRLRLADTETQATQQNVFLLQQAMEELRIQYEAELTETHNYVEEVKQALEKAQADLARTQSKAETLIADLQKNNLAEKSTHNRVMTQLQAEKQAIEKTLAETQQALEKVQTEYDALQTSVETLKTERQTAVTELETLRPQLTTAQTDLTTLQTEKQAINEQLTTIQTALDKKTAEYTQLQATATQLETDKQALTTQATEAQQTLHKTETDLADIRAQLAQATEEHKKALEAAQTQIKTLEASVAEAQKNLTAQTAELTTLQTTLAEKTDSLTNAEQTITTLKVEHEQQLEKLNQDAVTKLTETLDKMKAEYNATLQKKQDDLQTLEATFKDLQEKTYAVQATFVENVRAARDADIKNKQQTATLESQLEQAEQTQQKAEESILQLRQAIENLTAEKTEQAASADATISHAKENIDDLTQKLQQAETTLATNQQTQAKMRALETELSTQLETTRATVTELRATLEKTTAEASTAQAQVKTLETSLTAEQEKAVIAETRALKAETANTELLATMGQVTALGGVYTEKGILLILRDLPFASGQSALPDDLVLLDKVSELIKALPNRQVLIEGHTDSSGNPETNLTLSQQRAETVKTALIKRGVAENLLSSTGLGKENPIADNGTATGRKQNRRVEVTILPAK